MTRKAANLLRTSLALQIELTGDRLKDWETRPLTYTLILHLLPPKIDLKGVFHFFARARLLPLRIFHLLSA